MLASEFITKLQKQVNVHGDKPISILDYDCNDEHDFLKGRQISIPSIYNYNIKIKDNNIDGFIICK